MKRKGSLEMPRVFLLLSIMAIKIEYVNKTLLIALINEQLWISLLERKIIKLHEYPNNYCYVRFTNSFKSHCDVIGWSFSFKQSLIITGQFCGPSFTFSVAMSPKDWKQRMGYIAFFSIPTNTLFEKTQSVVGCSSICIALIYDKLCLIYTPFLSTWKKSLKHHRSISVVLKHHRSLLSHLLIFVTYYLLSWLFFNRKSMRSRLDWIVIKAQAVCQVQISLATINGQAKQVKRASPLEYLVLMLITVAFSMKMW